MVHDVHMRFRLFSIVLLLTLLTSWVIIARVDAQGIVVDHTSTNITQIPQSAIVQRKPTCYRLWPHLTRQSTMTG